AACAEAARCGPRGASRLGGGGPWSVAELTHQRGPERARLPRLREIDGLLVHPGVHHDQLALRVDVDALPAHAHEREHPAVAGQDPRGHDPRLIAVAEER